MYHKIYNPVHNQYYDIWKRQGIITLQNFLEQSNQKGGTTILQSVNIEESDIKEKSISEVIENYHTYENFGLILEKKLYITDENNLNQMIKKQEKYKKELRELRNNLADQGVPSNILNILNPDKETLKISVKRERTPSSDKKPFPLVKSYHKQDSYYRKSKLISDTFSLYQTNDSIDKKINNDGINYGKNNQITFNPREKTRIWNTSFINVSRPSYPFQPISTAGDGNCGYHSIIQSLIESFYILGSESSDILKKFIRHIIILGYNPSKIALNNITNHKIIIPRDIINYFRMFILQQTRENGNRFIPDDSDNQNLIHRLKGGIQPEKNVTINSDFWLDEYVIISVVEMFDVPILAYLKKIQQGTDKNFITGMRGSDHSDCNFFSNDSSTQKECNHMIFMFNNEVHFTYLTTSFSGYLENIKKALRNGEVIDNSITMEIKNLEKKQEEDKKKVIETYLQKKKAIEEWNEIVKENVKIYLNTYLISKYNIFLNNYSSVIAENLIEDIVTKIKNDIEGQIPFEVKYQKKLEQLKIEESSKRDDIDRLEEEAIKDNLDENIEKLNNILTENETFEKVDEINILVSKVEKEKERRQFLNELKSQIKIDFKKKLKEDSKINYTHLVSDYIENIFKNKAYVQYIDSQLTDITEVQVDMLKIKLSEIIVRETYQPFFREVMMSKKEEERELPEIVR